MVKAGPNKLCIGSHNHGDGGNEYEVAGREGVSTCKVKKMQAWFNTDMHKKKNVHNVMFR